MSILDRMPFLTAIVNGIAQILHPEKPREWFSQVHLPTDYTADEVIARINEAAKGTRLEGWYERRSVVDLMKLSHPDNPDQAASKVNRTKLATELGRPDYSGKPEENEWLFGEVIKAIAQRGIPMPSAGDDR
jgi:hypothetical protein